MTCRPRRSTLFPYTTLFRSAVHLRLIRPVAGLHHLRGTAVLYPHHRGPLRAAFQAPARAAALQSAGLSGAARSLYCAGGMDMYRIIAIQASVHVARPGVGAARHSGVSLLGLAQKRSSI